MLEDLAQRADTVAETVDEAARPVLEVTLLGEVPATYRPGTPSASYAEVIFGKRSLCTSAGRQLSSKISASKRNPVQRDDAVVAQFLDDLVGPGEREAHREQPVFVTGDRQDRAVEDRVLRLELVGVEEVVVHRAQVPHVVGPPGELHRPRPGDVDDRRRLD